MVLRSPLIAVLAGILVVAGGVSAQADPVRPGPGPTPVNAVGAVNADVGINADLLVAGNFRLQASPVNDLIDDLDARLPIVGVPTVLTDTNRYATSCTPDTEHLLASFCWDLADDIAPYWFPQGITTSADAEADGTYQGSAAILVSWYDNGTDGVNRGVRVSFIDRSTTGTPTYRHVLLVEPYQRADGQPSFRPIDIHAGGIFWYGYYLYVASTNSGFRVFDMRHIWRVSTTDGTAIGLQSDGTFAAYGYKYVLPQVFQYTRSTTGGYANLTFSFVALDRTSTPDSVIVGEYAYPGDGTRLVRFPIDYTDRMLAESSDGYVHGTEAYDVSVTSMQGATAINGKFYLSTSDGSGNRGDLATFTPGGAVVMHYDTLPIGPEDLSYWGPKGQLWSLTEHPGSRSVFAVRASAY